MCSRWAAIANIPSLPRLKYEISKLYYPDLDLLNLKEDSEAWRKRYRQQILASHVVLGQLRFYSSLWNSWQMLLKFAGSTDVVPSTSDRLSLRTNSTTVSKRAPRGLHSFFWFSVRCLCVVLYYLAAPIVAFVSAVRWVSCATGLREFWILLRDWKDGTIMRKQSLNGPRRRSKWASHHSFSLLWHLRIARASS